MAKFLIATGHTPSGTIGCGAVGKLNESNCTREVTPLIVQKLKSLGHEAVLIQFDKSNSYLYEDCHERTKKANAIGGDMFVEIHFNSGINYTGDGAEVLVVNTNSKAYASAAKVSEAISKTLKIKDRGVKTSSVIVLSKTSMPAMLVECQFVDGLNADKTYNADKIATAIVQGLTGQSVSSSPKYKKGWNKDDKGWWYSPDGDSYYKNEWKQINGEWYSFKDDGYAKCSTWEIYKGHWYYLKDNCKMAKAEWHTNHKGEKFYLLVDGKMAIGHHKIGDSCYDFNKDGVLQ